MKDLDTLLDKCIDRMNEGESLEECLASYPEHAKELEPLLRAMCDFRDTCSTMPRATAKSVVRRRLAAAPVNADRGLQKHQQRPMPLLGWPRKWATVAIVIVATLIGFGLHSMLTREVAPVVAQANFRLLLSDDVNAITDFDYVKVTVSGIGLQQGGESGQWINYDINPPRIEDLAELTGKNATEIWSGYVTPGEYTKVFIYVDSIEGMLLEGSETVDVKLSSNKLQISKPFTISAEDGNLVVDFVFDITVVKAGESGQYIVKPQIAESGPDQDFNDVTPKGKPEGAGDPEELKFKGTIESIDGTIWTIKIGDEIRTVDVSGAEIEGQPAVGLKAKVEGTVVDDVIIASEVEIKEVQEKEAEELKFEGTIESIDGTIWTIKIGSEVMTVDVSGAEIEGEPAVGLKAKVEGTIVDNTVVASEVEIKEAREEAEELEFEGTIESIDGTTWTIKIGNEVRTVDVSGAEIEGEPAVGLEAKVEGTVVDDTIVASQVEIKEAEEEG